MPDLSVTEDPNRNVITCCGEFDAEGVEVLHATVQRGASGRQSVVVDLTRVAFMGVDGIKALFHCANACRGGGVAVRVRASSPLRQILERLELGVFEFEAV